MNLEDQLRNHFEAKGDTLEVPMVELHLIPHPERSTPRRWTALAAVALAAIALFGFSQFSDTIRDPQQAPIAAPLPELGSITQTVPTDLALPIELEWTKVLDQGGLHLYPVGSEIYAIPGPQSEGPAIWVTDDALNWKGQSNMPWLLNVVAVGDQFVGLERSAADGSPSLKTSTDGRTWQPTTWPGEPNEFISFGGFDGDRFVMGLQRDPIPHNLKELVPEPYRSDPNIRVDMYGSSVEAYLQPLGIVVASFSADELGIEPANPNDPTHRRAVWTDDFESWQPLDLPDLRNPWVRPVSSDGVVMVDGRDQTRLFRFSNAAFSPIDLDFRLDALGGQDGQWAAYEMTAESGGGIHLSDDLRSWTTLELPTHEYLNHLDRGGLGVVGLVSFGQGFEPPETTVIYAEGGIEIALDHETGTMAVTLGGEWIFDIDLYLAEKQPGIKYTNGMLTLLSDEGAPLAEVDVTDITMPDWLSQDAPTTSKLFFSDGSSAWSTTDFIDIGATGWPIGTLVSDKFILVSFSDGVWMGTLKE